MLTIITPCKRIENLKAVSKSIPVDKNIIWCIVLDYDTPQVLDIDYNGKLKVIYANYPRNNWGHFQRNVGINETTEGYIYFLDDDTICHPNVLNIYRKFANTQMMVIGNQMLKGDKLRMRGQVPKVDHIDIASAIIHISLFKNIRLNYHYQADGELLEQLYRANKMYVAIINEAISYYNYLR